MSGAEPGPIGRISRFFFWALFGYWSLYVLVAPVTNIDSQMYDIARLSLAMKGGLFTSPYFTSVFQVMWPWTFDAVHLPFFELGWACALPSFCCLAGTCYVVFVMTRARLGADAAWVALVALLSLPCLIYQGTSTKNDIPLLFAGAVWVYGRWRWKHDNRGLHLFWMVFALGFMAGAKTTGVLYAGILALAMLVELRSDPRLALRVAGGLACSALLLGSLETYVESARLFGHPLGPPEVIGQLSNPDGARGAAANFSRYVAGSLYEGPTTTHSASRAADAVASAEQRFLAATGLTNAGYDHRFGDGTLMFFQSGLEELSGFGPMGTLAMLTTLAACVAWRPKAVWWQLAAAATAGFALVSLNVGYSAWGNRYLISWYALGTLALVCLLWERETPARTILRKGFAALAIAGAVAAPLLSFNRGPGSILASLRDRERFETCSYPLIGKVRDRLRALRRETPGSTVYYVACNDSLVLPIAEDASLDAVLVTPPGFADLAERGVLRKGDLVIEDYDTRSPLLVKVDEVTAPDIFSGRGTRTQAIYRIR
jgi:hypothetical protein